MRADYTFERRPAALTRSMLRVFDPLYGCASESAAPVPSRPADVVRRPVVGRPGSASPLPPNAPGGKSADRRL